VTPADMLDLLRRLVEEYDERMDSYEALAERGGIDCPVLAEARALVSKR
jgi:hypothetical protein